MLAFLSSLKVALAVSLPPLQKTQGRGIRDFILGGERKPGKGPATRRTWGTGRARVTVKVIEK